MGERNSNASSASSSLALPGAHSPEARSISPLLEIRRPHCTLNCDHCSTYLEDLYKQSTLRALKKIYFFYYSFLVKKINDILAIKLIKLFYRYKIINFLSGENKLDLQMNRCFFFFFVFKLKLQFEQF